MKLQKVVLPPPFAGVELAYVEHGTAHSGHVVVCVHGLTRNAHDFDRLGQTLARRGARVLAVDVVGRGRSSWLGDPRSYVVPAYAAHLAWFFRELGLTRVDWVGTSMGGLIGMVMAAHPQTPVARLVINDIGPFVPKAALEEIAGYLGQDLVFPDLAAAEAHLRVIHASFGTLDDAAWQDMAARSVRAVDGGYRLHYDPAIRVPFMEAIGADMEIWQLYDAVHCPTLVVRGAASRLLLPETAEAMKSRGPKATIATIPQAGHAPALMEKAQIELIAAWLGLAESRRAPLK